MLNLVVAIRTLGAFLLPFLYHALEAPNFLGRDFRLIANSPLASPPALRPFRGDLKKDLIIRPRH
jgi:hypothetical protein